MAKKRWFYIAGIFLVISVASLFTAIITYVTPEGVKFSFNILDILGNSDDFNKNIINSYKGPVVWDITGTIATIIGIVAVVSLLLAVIGLLTLRAQRPNKWQFILTIVGMVGITIPSIILLVVIIGYGKYYEGALSFGAAPIVSPLAVVVCIIAVVRRKNKVAEEMRREAEAKGLLRKAGDL